MTQNVVPAPVYADGIVYLISGFRGAALQAVELAKAKGDATSSAAMKWSYAKGTPYVPSPVLVNGRLYFFANNTGMFSCLDAKTGTPHFAQERLEGISSVYASPLAAGGKLYLASREGSVVVLKEGPELQVLAQSDLGDPFDASPIAIGPYLYLRGHAKLYCFAEKSTD
jgi:outer membrane protein assembly factor BamB